MKVLLVGALAAFCSVCLLLYIWSPVRVQTYILSSKLEPSWIAIEYDNPNCSALKENRLWRELVIPESGYLCTSNPMEMGWTYDRFYLIGDQGERTRLNENGQIFAEASIRINENACKVTAKIFKYGSGRASNESTSFIEKYHPECRQRGTVTTPAF